MTLADNLRSATTDYHEKQKRERVANAEIWVASLGKYLQIAADSGKYSHDFQAKEGLDRACLAWELAHWCHEGGLTLYLCNDLYEHYLEVPQDGNNPIKGVHKLEKGNHSFTISWSLK